MLIAAMVAAPVAALAQGTGVPPTDLHRYPLPTYEEDWRALQKSDRTDVWDPIKFVPLSADGAISLSLGGEARATYERFGNPNFGLTPSDPAGYLLQRYLLHTDLRLGSRVRVWTEFNSSLENGRIGGPRPVIDEDKLDLHQAFVDVTVGATGPSAAVLRVGRQEIALGAGRMYALREGPNVPFSFDGVRVIAHAGPWRLDGWAARPVDTTPGVFDDGSAASFDVWGVYGSRVIALSTKGVGLDVYYMGLVRDAAHFDQGTANENRHTFGARVWHRGVWAYDAEAMFQAGRFGSGDIRAWRSVIEGSHLLTDGCLVAAFRTRPRRRERRQESHGPEPPDIQRDVPERPVLRPCAAAWSRATRSGSSRRLRLRPRGRCFSLSDGGSTGGRALTTRSTASRDR
jgi:hypothetical protein